MHTIASDVTKYRNSYKQHWVLGRSCSQCSPSRIFSTCPTMYLVLYSLCIRYLAILLVQLLLLRHCLLYVPGRVFASRSVVCLTHFPCVPSTRRSFVYSIAITWQRHLYCDVGCSYSGYAACPKPSRCRRNSPTPATSMWRHTTSVEWAQCENSTNSKYRYRASLPDRFEQINKTAQELGMCCRSVRNLF